MKSSYLGAENKRITQNTTLSSSQKKIYALGGPDILDYINVLKSKGYEDITIFENRKNIYEHQVRQNPDCKLILGNILNNLGEKCFYDIDLCCCIRSVEQYLPRILTIPEFSITFSIRPIGFDETIKTFRRYGNAYFMYYQDTVPMITFFNNKIIQHGKEKGRKTIQY